MKTNRKRIEKPFDNENLPGYPIYPPSEDIFNTDVETNLNPEDISKEKINDTNDGKWSEKNFNENHSGDDLDVPGSELDDVQEEIGSEDEENNYYSLGGDGHNDLEENKG